MKQFGIKIAFFSMTFLVIFASHALSATTFNLKNAKSAKVVFYALDKELEVRLNKTLILQKLVLNKKSFNYTINLMPLLNDNEINVLDIKVFTPEKGGTWAYGYKIVIDGGAVADVSNAGKSSGKSRVHWEDYKLKR